MQFKPYRTNLDWGQYLEIGGKPLESPSDPEVSYYVYRVSSFD